MGTDKNKKKRAVIVVHGLGDQTPGWTVESFAKSYSVHTGATLDTHTEVNWLEESDQNSPDEITTFPSHIRRVRKNNEELVFAEVYWADLSRVSTGLWGVLTGIFQIVMGLRYISFASADPVDLKGRAAKLVDRHQRLSVFVAILLRGPVLALNLFIGILVCEQLINEYFMLNYNKQFLEGDKSISVIVSGLLFLLIGILIYKYSVAKERKYSDATAISIFICGILASIFAIFTSSVVYTYYDEIFLDVLIGFWVIIVSLMALMIINYLISYFFLEKDQSRQRSLWLSFTTTILSAGLWGFVILIIWSVALSSIPDEYMTCYMKSLMEKGLRSSGLMWAGILSSMFVFVGSTICRNFWVKHYPTSTEYDSRRPINRLIIPKLLPFILIIFLVGWLGSQLVYMYEPIEVELIKFIKFSNDLAITLSVILTSIISLLLSHARIGIDIVLDIVNHFKYEEVPVVKRIRSVGLKPNLSYSRRERMIDRFIAVVENLSKQENFDEVIIIAHSQGTLIALEGLKRNSIFPENNNTLVTMGSPYSHIYQHYFSHSYPLIEEESLPQVSKWHNIF